MSSQCMFDSALETERDLGLNYWEDECPKVEGISFAVPVPRRQDHGLGGEAGQLRQQWTNDSRSPAGWLSSKQGGELIEAADIADLESCARSCDLVIVASGKGAIARCSSVTPAARLFRTATYPGPDLCSEHATARALRCGVFQHDSESGEYFVFPALTASGPCEIMVFEGIPGGPMDCWSDVKTPAEHLASAKTFSKLFSPGRRSGAAISNSPTTTASWRAFCPAVRKPIATLPSGRTVLGMADAIVLNDPLTGQGSNNAARCAEIYLESIVERGNGPADARMDAAHLRPLLDWLREMGGGVDELAAQAAGSCPQASRLRREDQRDAPAPSSTALTTHAPCSPGSWTRSRRNLSSARKPKQWPSASTGAITAGRSASLPPASRW